MTKWRLREHQLIVVMTKVICRGGHTAHRLSWQGPYIPQSVRAPLLESREELDTNSDESNKLVTSCVYRHHYAYQSLKYFSLWTEWNRTTCTILYYCFPVPCDACRYCSCIKIKCYVFVTRTAFSECPRITWFAGFISIGRESLLQKQ